jgi:TusE/DsrC/DsvC family sulfur relay protein
MLPDSYLDYSEDYSQDYSQDYSGNNTENYADIDKEGYLIDPSNWNRAFTDQRAREAGIDLTDRHWRLIELIREKYLNLGALPPMRSICKAVGFDKHELKQQFGSCLNLWKIAGLPDPGEEARAYMN